MTDANDLIQQRALADAMAAKSRGDDKRGLPRGHAQSAGLTGEGVSDIAELARLLDSLKQVEVNRNAAEKLIVIGEFSVSAARVPATFLMGLQALTRGEAAALRMLGWGRANADIAMLLDCSENTIRTHLHNAIGKLDVDGMRELSTLAGLLFHPLD